MSTDPSTYPDTKNLPEDFIEQLQQLDTQQLKQTIYCVQNIISDRHKSAAEAIDEDAENTIRIEERSVYTEVVKRESDRDVLYHVTRESRPDGSEELNWRYIGPVAHG